MTSEREAPAGRGGSHVEPTDAEARRFASDPGENVVLEASAGTGKTSVLVERYVNLLLAGVDPANVLAMTFTRKAAAEMRERIVARLRSEAAAGRLPRVRWVELRDRLGDIAISTIDAFCLSLLREFPLEAGVDPGFTLADETATARLIEESLDQTLRICGRQAHDEPEMAMVFARLGVGRLRTGLAHLLQRRQVAWEALDRYLTRGPAMRSAEACRRGIERLAAAMAAVPGGITAFLADGPVHHPGFALLAHDLGRLEALMDAPPAAVRSLLDRVREYFLTADGRARRRIDAREYPQTVFLEPSGRRRHRVALERVAPGIREALRAFDRDINAVLARGVHRIFAVALDRYRRALDRDAVLDFAGVLERAIGLLRRMDEFAQSRFRLESRYHHVLVDEFQDTSRAQWALVSLLVESWGEGVGPAHEGPLPPSIFVVGDRKQSIYRFRDAEVSILGEAEAHVQRLRSGGPRVRRSISHSFRSDQALLAFVNDVFEEIDKPGNRQDAFRYDAEDRFPILEPAGPEPVLGLLAGADGPECAEAVAGEIVRILSAGLTVRDRSTGIRRAVRPGDIAVLFRSRESHRELERALEMRRVPVYVYKGLGFFDADEVRDVCAAMRFLAEPASDLHAAAFLRSRLVRLSDAGLAVLGPRLADALGREAPAPGEGLLDEEDRRVLARLRTSLREWLPEVDRIPPAELLDRVLAESAYAWELRGPRHLQAFENVKKIRGLVRRIQNRGFATSGRIAAFLDLLSGGDESNAALDALEAVNLMTVHAAKGLEFPVVFVVNLARGTGGARPPIRVTAEGGDGGPAVSVGSFLSEADEDERAREREETKRLLYVALTRARDRLYLGSVLNGGLMRPAPGSLGEVLPRGVLDLFTRAGATSGGAPDSLDWVAASGRHHRLALVRPEPSGAVFEAGRMPGSRVDMTPLVGRPALERRGATTPPTGEPPVGEAGALDQAGRSARLLGTLVHRLLAAGAPDGPAEAAAAWLEGLVDFSERVAAEEAGETLARAVRLYLALRRDAGLSSLLASGEAIYEVPFTMRAEGDVEGEPQGPPVLIRGVIDCLVRFPDGSMTVLELKTGAPCPEDRGQLDIYVRAARALFPGQRVQGMVFYCREGTWERAGLE